MKTLYFKTNPNPNIGKNRKHIYPFRFMLLNVAHRAFDRNNISVVYEALIMNPLGQMYVQFDIITDIVFTGMKKSIERGPY